MDFSNKFTVINAIISSKIQEDLIISWHDLQEMGILHQNFPKIINISSTNCYVNSHSQFNYDNIEELKDHLIKDYKNVISDDLNGKVLAGDPMRIHLGGEVKPKRILTSKQIPSNYQKEADKVINKLIDSGVIIKEDSPTSWISRAFFIQKEGGKGGV